MASFDTERDILLAIREGNLAENAHLDVKRETGTTDSARAETARDLASFAIHGGTLLIGVDEDKTSRTMSASPIVLEGAAEKLEQIAANRIDPPLFVRVRDIPSDDDSSTGFLLVEIPPSSQAPHMVGGRYYARGDRTKRQLTDAEVVALHAAREPAQRRIAEALQAWADRPVVSEERRSLGHLNIVAMPLSRIPTGSFLDVSRAPNNTTAFNIAQYSGQSIPMPFVRFSPSLGNGPNWVRRRDGSAYTSLDAGVPVLQDDGREASLVDFELRDDGSFGILMGRLTEVRTEQTAVVYDFGAVGYAWRAIRVAAWISAHTGYRGAWGFGLLADGMAGMLSAQLVSLRDLFQSVHPFSADDYAATTSANLAEIEDAPAEVVERLIGGFLHGVGSYDAFKATLVADA